MASQLRQTYLLNKSKNKQKLPQLCGLKNKIISNKILPNFTAIEG